MSENLPRFKEGENVKYVSTGKIGTVNKVIKGSRGYSYKVTIEGKVRTISQRFLEPVVDIEENIIEDFKCQNLGSHDSFKIFQTWFRLSRPVEGNLYSYLGRKTVFNVHQFKPLLRFLSACMSLDVGLKSFLFDSLLSPDVFNLKAALKNSFKSTSLFPDCLVQFIQVANTVGSQVG